MTNKVKQEVRNHFKTAKILSWMTVLLCVFIAFSEPTDGYTVLGCVMLAAAPVATIVAIGRFK